MPLDLHLWRVQGRYKVARESAVFSNLQLACNNEDCSCILRTVANGGSAADDSQITPQMPMRHSIDNDGRGRLGRSEPVVAMLRLLT